jgi:hypothetical protein
VQEVSGDVDKDRLTTDEAYGYFTYLPLCFASTTLIANRYHRKEVLLGLGRTSKKAALTVAFTLARRYTFPEYLVPSPCTLHCTHSCARSSLSHFAAQSGGHREFGVHLAQH